MATYWISFRIGEHGNDDERRRGLETHMLVDSSRHWKDTTSFLLVETEQTIDSLAQRAEDAIWATYDLVLIRELDTKSARVIGTVEDDDLFLLMPYCKRA